MYLAWTGETVSYFTVLTFFRDSLNAPAKDLNLQLYDKPPEKKRRNVAKKVKRYKTVSNSYKLHVIIIIYIF